MVPRPDMVTVAGSTPVRDVREIAMAAGYSRIPAYEQNIDDIIGIVYVKDLFRAGDDASDRPVREFVRPARFVPETKRVSELMREMQRDKFHMASVVDEYGGTAGLVTLEDLLEEIVGEIRDEDDVEGEPIVDEGNGSYVFSAKVSFDELRERLGLEIEPEGFETVGGYVLARLGRVPSVGETFDLDGLHVEVLEAERRRIHKVRFRKATSVPSATPETAPR